MPDVGLVTMTTDKPLDIETVHTTIDNRVNVGSVSLTTILEPNSYWFLIWGC